MYTLDLLPAELKTGAAELCSMLEIPTSDAGIPITAKQGDMSIEKCENGVVITYNTKPQFFRMLSMLTGRVEGKYCENPRQTMLCYMADQSRNAVMNMNTAKRMIRYLAALGFDSLMLYTEDTYEVKNQPYFGYMRGRWTQDELKELVAYGELFGIELIPCIQALAHLKRMMRWKCYKDIIDFDDILLAGDEKTYAFIEDTFKACAACFKSRKINLGLDEAHMLGLGKYLDKNGYHNRSEIMLSHLKRICEIAEKYNFHPMMWSDMFFRLAFGTYYVKSGEITKEVRDKVPHNLTLIYWDYYTSDKEMFSHMVKCHKSFDNPIAFAGGCHKWGGFVANNMVTYELESMHIDECIKEGLTQIIATGWGDDGAEAAHFSIAPGLTVYAEKCYKGSFDREWFDARFENIFKIPMKPFEIMDAVDCPPGFKTPESGRRTYFHKAMVYFDVLTGLLNKHIKRDEAQKFYADMAHALEPYCDNKNFGYVVEVARSVAKLNSYKATIPHDLRTAYGKKDKNALAELAKKDIPALIEAADKLLKAVETQWRLESRAFGLEVQQLRLGGMKQRLNGVIDVINAYCNGSIDKIDELEEQVLWYDCRTEDGDDLTPERGTGNTGWRNTSTVNII